MDNTRAWRNDLEVIESSLAPFKELKSFFVPLNFDLFVFSESFWSSCDIGLDGMIDDKINRAERVDLIGFSSEFFDRVSHGSKINDGWDTGEILKDDSGRSERDFDLFRAFLFPVEDGVDVVFGEREVVTVSEGTFEENSDGEREAF